MPKPTLADNVQRALEGHMSPNGMTSINRGGTSPFSGKRVVKVSNGMPGKVLVRVCEPGGARDIHIYTGNCGDTIAIVRQVATELGVTVR